MASDCYDTLELIAQCQSSEQRNDVNFDEHGGPIKKT